jgi:hypothetical protein
MKGKIPRIQERKLCTSSNALEFLDHRIESILAFLASLPLTKRPLVDWIPRFDTGKGGILIFEKYSRRIDGNFIVLAERDPELLLVSKELEQLSVQKEDFAGLFLLHLTGRFRATHNGLLTKLVSLFTQREFKWFNHRYRLLKTSQQGKPNGHVLTDR